MIAKCLKHHDLPLTIIFKLNYIVIDIIYTHFSNLSTVTPKTLDNNIWIVDNFLPTQIYNSVVQDINKISNWELCDDDVTTRYETTKLFQSSVLQTLLLCMNSNYMCEWLNHHVGTKGLLPDPYLHGAGLCRTEQGSKLSLHCDFNWANHISLNREINAILYLTKTWQEDWNGDLQFWNNDRTECYKKLYPLPNRLIFWKYDKDLWHGMPDILANPKNNPRDQICIWYYKSNDLPKNNPQTSVSKS